MVFASCTVTSTFFSGLPSRSEMPTTTSAGPRLCAKAKTVAGASRSSVLVSKVLTAFRTSWLKPASLMCDSSHSWVLRLLKLLQELLASLVGLLDLGLSLRVFLDRVEVAVVQDLGRL